MRNLYILGLTYIGATAALALTHSRRPAVLMHSSSTAPVEFTGAAGSWFRAMKPYCNAVEIDFYFQQTPPPEGIQGAGYGAACLALAGRIDQARDHIRKEAGDSTWAAAGIVFNIAHPIADAGDDLSAGPIMELVVDFWPNHYQALYHAGMSRYELGQHDRARTHLTSFLQHYDLDDGFARHARTVLEHIGK